MELLTVVGHKMYAPKGVAALYIRRGTPPLVPQLSGGGQERGLRAATENVAGIVALGAAAAIAQAEHVTDAARALAHRERLLSQLLQALPGLQVNGSLTHRLQGNLSLTIPHVTAEQLIAATPELAFSAGAACHTGRTTPSPVLTAIGLKPDQAARTIRLGVGRWTTDADIATAASTARRRRPAICRGSCCARRSGPELRACASAGNAGARRIGGHQLSRVGASRSCARFATLVGARTQLVAALLGEQVRGKGASVRRRTSSPRR